MGQDTEINRKKELTGQFKNQSGDPRSLIELYKFPFDAFAMSHFDDGSGHAKLTLDRGWSFQIDCPTGAILLDPYNGVALTGTAATSFSISVITDSTLTGDGTLLNPLHVVAGGGGLTTVATDDTIDGDGTPGNPLSVNFDEIEVHTDSTLTGDGSDDNPLHVVSSGGISDAPSDGKTYGRNNAAWVEVVAGGAMATFSGSLNFGTGVNSVSANISDATMTATKVIQADYTNKLEEVIVQDMRIRETSRTPGVGFTITGFASNRAAGSYNFTVITSGT